MWRVRLAIGLWAFGFAAMGKSPILSSWPAQAHGFFGFDFSKLQLCHACLFFPSAPSALEVSSLFCFVFFSASFTKRSRGWWWAEARVERREMPARKATSWAEFLGSGVGGVLEATTREGTGLGIAATMGDGTAGAGGVDFQKRRLGRCAAWGAARIGDDDAGGLKREQLGYEDGSAGNSEEQQRRWVETPADWAWLIGIAAAWEWRRGHLGKDGSSSNGSLVMIEFPNLQKKKIND